MYIEDLVIALATSKNVGMNPYDSKLIYSFFDQLTRNSGFTEKQELLSVRILKRQAQKLYLIFGQDISQFLENPKFRLVRRSVTLAKHMKIIDHPNFGKIIQVEFPFNEKLLAKFRQEKVKLNMAQWDSEYKSWFFSLDEQSLQFLNQVAIEEDFTVDEKFKNYQTQINEIESNIDQYIPIVSFNGKILKFLNISEKIPQPTNLYIIENLFLARKLGISTWDDNIQNTDEWKNSSQVVKNFLLADPGETISLNLEESDVFRVTEIIKHMMPVMIVIPGGSELEKMKKSLELLKEIGIANNEICVLFRLPSETGIEFNNFVRDQKLNSSISDHTKAVIISNKIPKTILDKQIKFNCVVSFNFYNIHYSLKNLLEWHHNVINIVDDHKLRILNFDKL